MSPFIWYPNSASIIFLVKNDSIFQFPALTLSHIFEKLNEFLASPKAFLPNINKLCSNIRAPQILPASLPVLQPHGMLTWSISHDRLQKCTWVHSPCRHPRTVHKRVHYTVNTMLTHCSQSRHGTRPYNNSRPDTDNTGKEKGNWSCDPREPRHCWVMLVRYEPRIVASSGRGLAVADDGWTNTRGPRVSHKVVFPKKVK